ncbi:protein chibby homolog 2 [Rhynchocyon petersi]
MSPLECSECLDDQLLYQTYIWHLTLRGTTEPFLRLHNLYSTPRCMRQTNPPRVGRRVVSQHSYPLNRFSSVPLDAMERPTSQADLELDYNPPRVQLSDEMFVFQDGRWVNENCRLQSPYFSPSPSLHHKLHHKRLAKEYLLLEENKSLRDENKSLREENKALRRENRLLQAFWEEQRAALGREGGRASPPPHRDAAPDALQGPRAKESSTLQLLREENRALQQLLEQRKAYWAPPEDKAAPTEEPQPAASARAEPPGPGLLPDQPAGLSSPFEEPKAHPSPQDSSSKTLHALREMAGAPADQEGQGAAGGQQEAGQFLQLLREMNQALQALREENRGLQALREENRLLQEENRALHALREEHRAFQEENKALWENDKLKLQQKLVIDTVTEVTARMEMLIEELYAFMPAKSKDPKKPSRV